MNSHVRSIPMTLKKKKRKKNNTRTARHFLSRSEILGMRKIWSISSSSEEFTVGDRFPGESFRSQILPLPTDDSDPSVCEEGRLLVLLFLPNSVALLPSSISPAAPGRIDCGHGNDVVPLEHVPLLEFIEQFQTFCSANGSVREIVSVDVVHRPSIMELRRRWIRA